jgi:HK97 family phage portal protein
MGVLDIFRRSSIIYQAVEVSSTSPSAAEVIEALRKVTGMAPAQLWETQHNVRTVVDFLARNIGQLGLPVYQRVSDTDRQRLVDSPVAKLLSNPNPAMTAYDLKVALVSDLALHDEAWWLLTQTAGGWQLRPLAVDLVTIVSGSEIDGDLIVHYLPDFTKPPIRIEGKNLIHFKNWTPYYGDRGSPVVATLKDVLAEQIASQQFRTGIWKNGGQIGSYIMRPKDAPSWSDEGSKRFKEDMKAYKAKGANVGGMPVLEDGMTINQVRFNAREEQWIEAANLSLETVARAWHINPAMLGATGGVSYANVREFRKMLYGETLGPWLKMIQDRINSKLVPLLDPRAGVYVEFNVKAKLAASFDEQAAAYQSAVGRPYMTANEIRAMENLPSLGGDADSLVTPLNVLVSEQGQAESQDVMSAEELTARVNAAAGLIRSGFEPASALIACGLDPVVHLGLLPVTVQRPVTPDGAIDQGVVDALKQLTVLRKNKAARAKGMPDSASERITANILAKFFKRQRESVLSKLNAKADASWWDGKRWDKELADELYRSAMSVTGQVAADVLAATGLAADAYDASRTEKFLRAVAESRAGKINSTTFDQIQSALDDPGEDADGNPVRSPAKVFDEVEGSRGEVIAATLLTTFAGFATMETAKQNSSEATKTWAVNSGNPRSEHADMDGETVPVRDTFSNGADWPGDPVLGAEGVANCQCSVEVSL